MFAWSSLAGDFSRAEGHGTILLRNGEEWLERCLRVYGHEQNWGRQARARELAAAKGLSLAQVALAYVLSQGMRGVSAGGLPERGGVWRLRGGAGGEVDSGGVEVVGGGGVGL